MLGLAGATFLACAGTPKNERWALPSDLSQDPPVVVLVAIDGVRHQDVFHGPDPRWGRGHTFQTRRQLVPHLVEMERWGAVLGAPGSDGFYASGPNFVSLPGYMEMLSGTSKTRCTENDCMQMTQPTLMDDVQEEAPDDPTRSGVFSSWSKIEVAAAAKSRGVISAGRFKGAHLALLEEFPACRRALAQGAAEHAGHTGFRADRWTGQLALSFFEEARPEFMFVSLGETDERAHEGSYGAYLHALNGADDFVGAMMKAMVAREMEGRQTLLLVTTDHGRSDNFKDHGRRHPESAQGFLFAAGSVVPSVGRLKGRAFLRDIAPTIRELRGIPHPDQPDRGQVIRSIVA
jgi:hypothetical protein